MIYFDEYRPNEYRYSSDQVINGDSHTVVWYVRQTKTLKLWVVECNCGSFMLPAQRVYSTNREAMQIAADGMTYGIKSESTVWKVDNSVGPLKPVKFRVKKSYVSYDYI